MSTAVQYSALPTSLEDNNESDEKLASSSSSSAPSKPRSAHDRFLLYATISTVLITVLSFGLTLSDKLQGLPHTPAARKALRRPNPFPNPEWLREIAKIHNRTFEPIVNIAPLSFQMKVGDKKRKIVEDVSRERDTVQGRVWPDDRKFLVSHNTSTVMQFRTRDFDMERCVLTLSIPSDTQTLTASSRVSNVPSTIEVWALDNSLEIHPSIFWGTAPKRTHLLTTFEVTGEKGRKWESKAFRCETTSFTTLEFVCKKDGKEGGECQVEFWQDREKPHAGVYVVQHHAAPTDQI